MTTNPQRHLPIEGTHNFRDAGGYPTRDGGAMRWRTLFRSDSLHALTDVGLAAVRELGVRTQVDLRAPYEADRRPSALVQGDMVEYRALELGVEGSDPRAPTAYDPAELYRMFLDKGHGALGPIMGALASKAAFPMVINCTVGKDRTGLVIALLHELAGVHRDDVVADYALSGLHAAELIKEIHERSTASGIAREHSLRLLACDPESMTAALAHLDREHGGVDCYMGALGLDATQTTALRDALVER